MIAPHAWWASPRAEYYPVWYGPGDITCNFAKFLVDRRGHVVARFDPKTPPIAPEIRQAIEREMA